MVALHFDVPGSDDERRRQLHGGDIHVSSPDSSGIAFCEFARGLVEDAFRELDPELAQYSMAVEEYAALLADLKPQFIHHPHSKELIRALLESRGCDLDETYFDVPRLRTSTSDGYLTSGIAYAWHPHRDTWYSAPMAQLNHWLPIYPVTSQNAMAFHLEYFDVPIDNDSAKYNYYEWNAKYRRTAAANIGAESRPLPRPLVPIDSSSATVLLPRVGGLIAFSGQHLHSSVPNTSGRTRFSIDFRTVHIRVVMDGISAPNVDSACTGSSIRYFVRASDFTSIPDHVVEKYHDGTESSGKLVYEDNLASASDRP
jgi:hypothetical protein